MLWNANLLSQVYSRNSAMFLTVLFSCVFLSFLRLWSVSRKLHTERLTESAATANCRTHFAQFLLRVDANIFPTFSIRVRIAMPISCKAAKVMQILKKMHDLYRIIQNVWWNSLIYIYSSLKYSPWMPISYLKTLEIRDLTFLSTD